MFCGRMMARDPLFLPLRMEPVAWCNDEASNMMEEMMDMTEGWRGGSLVMRPGILSRPRSRWGPYDANPSGRYCITRSPLSIVMSNPHYNKNNKATNKDKCKDSDKSTSKTTSKNAKCTTTNNSNDNGDNTTSCHCKRTSVARDDVPNRTSVTDDGAAQTIKTHQEGSGSSSSVSSNKPAPARDQRTPWQFSVDMTGCQKVMIVTDSGVLTVEGVGRRGHSTMMIHHSTTLPPHVSPDTLTATVEDGRLTVSQRPGAHVADVRILPIITPGEEVEAVGDADHQQLPQKQHQDGQQSQHSHHQNQQHQDGQQSQHSHQQNQQHQDGQQSQHSHQDKQEQSQQKQQSQSSPEQE